MSTIARTVPVMRPLDRINRVWRQVRHELRATRTGRAARLALVVGAALATAGIYGWAPRWVSMPLVVAWYIPVLPERLRRTRAVHAAAGAALLVAAAVFGILIEIAKGRA